jgi:hypothetical protein
MLSLRLKYLDQKILDGFKNYISCWFCVFGSGIVVGPIGYWQHACDRMQRVHAFGADEDRISVFCRDVVGK